MPELPFAERDRASPSPDRTIVAPAPNSPARPSSPPSIELRRWCQRRGITEHQLASAIGKVGPSPRRLREYFRIPR